MLSFSHLCGVIFVVSSLGRRCGAVFLVFWCRPCGVAFVMLSFGHLCGVIFVVSSLGRRCGAVFLVFWCCPCGVAFVMLSFGHLCGVIFAVSSLGRPCGVVFLVSSLWCCLCGAIFQGVELRKLITLMLLPTRIQTTVAVLDSHIKTNNMPEKYGWL